MNTLRLQTHKMETTMKQINFNDSKHKKILKSKLKALDERKSKNMKDTSKVAINISKGDIEFIKNFHEEMKECCLEFFKDSDDDTEVTIFTSFDVDDDSDDFFSN
jgi:hypothetical protein